MESQPLKTIKLIDNPAYYVSFLILNIFSSITSIVLLNNTIVLNYNAISFMVSFALAIDFVIRGKGKGKDYLYPRYNVQILQSILSLSCLVFAYKEYQSTLLVPLIFFRLHYDVIKDMDSIVMRIVNYIFLVVGLIYTPLLIIYGNIKLDSPVFLIYLVLGSYTSIVLFREFLKNPSFVKDLSVSISLINRESVGISNLMLRDSVEGIRKDMDAVPRHRMCPWHTNIIKDIDLINEKADADNMELDISRLMQLMKENFSIKGYSIVFTGLEHNNENNKPLVVAALVKYFVELFCYNFDESCGNPTVWVTSTKNRITVKDNFGGNFFKDMTEKDKKIVYGIVSYSFFRLYNVKVFVEDNEDNGVFKSNKATIVF